MLNKDIDKPRFNNKQYMMLLDCSRKQDMTKWNEWRKKSNERILLGGANLSGANLSKANLSGANLSEADLSGANLSEADLSEADLSEANLLGINLSKANLSKTNFLGANLLGANLDVDLFLKGFSYGNVDYGIVQNKKDKNSNGLIYLGDNENLKTIIYPLYYKRVFDKNKNDNVFISLGHDIAFEEIIGNKNDRVLIPLGYDKQEELIINLADDITFEEIINLMTALNNLHKYFTGIEPKLNGIQIGQNTKELSSMWEDS